MSSGCSAYSPFPLYRSVTDKRLLSVEILNSAYQVYHRGENAEECEPQGYPGTGIKMRIESESQIGAEPHHENKIYP